MATAIDLFIKSGDVQTTTTGVGVVAPGIAVNAGGYPGATVAPGTSTTSGAGTGKVL